MNARFRRAPRPNTRRSTSSGRTRHPCRRGPRAARARDGRPPAQGGPGARPPAPPRALLRLHQAAAAGSRRPTLSTIYTLRGAAGRGGRVMLQVFVFGPIAITAGYWEQRGVEVEKGARVEIRRVVPDEVPGAAPGVAGLRLLPVTKASGVRTCSRTTPGCPCTTTIPTSTTATSASGTSTSSSPATRSPSSWTGSRTCLRSSAKAARPTSSAPSSSMRSGLRCRDPGGDRALVRTVAAAVR